MERKTFKYHPNSTLNQVGKCNIGLRHPELFEYSRMNPTSDRLEVRGFFHPNTPIEREIFESIKIALYFTHVKVKNCTFLDCEFTKETFWDTSVFENCIFEDCDFTEISIRWSSFKNCTFKNCHGNINWFYGVAFHCNCIFENTHIEIITVNSTSGHLNYYKRKRVAPNYIGE